MANVCLLVFTAGLLLSSGMGAGESGKKQRKNFKEFGFGVLNDLYSMYHYRGTGSQPMCGLILLTVTI